MSLKTNINKRLFVDGEFPIMNKINIKTGSIMKHTGRIILIVVLLATVGCHKKETAAPQATAVNAVAVVQQDYPSWFI